MERPDWVIKYRDILKGKYGDRKAILIRLDNDEYINERLDAVSWNDEDCVLTYTRRTDSPTDQRDRPIETWMSPYDDIQGMGVLNSAEDFVDIADKIGYPADKAKAIADSFTLDIHDYADSTTNNHSSASNPRKDIVY